MILHSYVSLPEGTKSCHFHRFFGQHWIAIPQELGKWWQSPEKLGYIRIPSGYVKITIEHGPNGNSWFTELKDCDFPVRYVKLPEDNSHIHSPSFQWGRTSLHSPGAPLLVKHHFSIKKCPYLGGFLYHRKTPPPNKTWWLHIPLDRFITIKISIF